MQCPVLQAAGRSVLDNKDAKFIPQNEAQEKELKVFACGECGFEMMPARGREGKFFAKDFKCPICKAPKEKFWDLNDPNDPRNQVCVCLTQTQWVSGRTCLQDCFRKICEPDC